MTIEWSPELTLNNELLDRQHVELFRKLEDASAALDGPRETIEGVLAGLQELLVAHLSGEERLMDETLYPERTRHKSAHELFLADFEQMRRELRASGPTQTVADWVRRRIPEWLRFHIRVNDEPLAAWLARHRPRPAEGKTRKKRDGRNLS